MYVHSNSKFVWFFSELSLIVATIPIENETFCSTPVGCNYIVISSCVIGC